MLQLSRLSRLRSFVRFNPPGHANPYFFDRARFIDPSHPAAKLPIRSFPSFVCPQFTVRAFPNAILQEPVDFVPINPLLATDLVRTRTKTKGRQTWWSKLAISDIHTGTGLKKKQSNRTAFNAMRRHSKFAITKQIVNARLASLAESGRRCISLLFHTSKKATSKSSVIRRRLRSKMVAAIRLVVDRNADVVASDQPRPEAFCPPLRLVSRPFQKDERLVLQGWTYVVIPDLAIYKTPLPVLVQAVRKALLSLSHQSIRLESSWSALPQAKVRTPRRPAVDGQLPSIHTSPKVVGRSQLAIQIPRHLHPLPRSSERAHAPPEPAKHDNISARLYSYRPIVLPREKPQVKK